MSADRWRALGEQLGRELAALMPVGFGERLRAHYAALYGKCRRCDAPLGGPSPEQICTGCHADEDLAEGLGGGGGGDA